MPENSDLQQFVLLPPRGMTARSERSNPELASFLVSLSSAVGPRMRRVSASGVVAEASRSRDRRSREVPMRVLDSIHEDGAKLVEMSPLAVSDLRAEQPGMRIVPVVFYEPALAPRLKLESRVRASRAGDGVKITLKIVSRTDGTPVAGAKVVAFTNFANREGADGVTNGKGEVKLALGASSRKLQRLYVFPRMSFWGLLKKNVTVSSGKEFGLRPIDLSFTDSKRFFYGDAPDGIGAGIKVGVIDTGIAEHADLLIDGGANTVTGERENDFGDNGDGHGTHVAGIIAARGSAPSGVRGLAPSVTLRSYRVFGKNRPGASNFAIAKAIDRERDYSAILKAVEGRLTMNKYILRFRGKGIKPEEDVELIRSLPETTVLDDSARMLLVEAPEDELRTALQSLPDWVMAEEKFIPRPDPRPRVRNRAADFERE